jgi:hypothetical protein
VKQRIFSPFLYETEYGKTFTKLKTKPTHKIKYD